MTIKNPTTCNQCHQQLNGCAIIVSQSLVNYCANPECPNYALLQFSVEDMVKLGGNEYQDENEVEYGLYIGID